MSKRFFTNEGENTLLKKFAGVFTHNPDIERFDALVGYLRASGYFALRPHLEKVPLIRIIVGIDVDTELARHHRKGLLMLGDADKTLSFVRAKLAEDVQGAPYRREIEEGIRQFVADVASKRVEIRAHSTKKLHAKLYIFLPTGFCEHKPGAVITGSSNLTAAGLGVEDAASNYEFNVVLHDYDEVVFAKNEFEKLWGEGVSVLPEAVKGVVRESYLREDLTPFELYIKFLIEYFGPAIDYDPNSERDMPKGRKALSYQGDAVNDGWLKLQKHGGFFLADVVGLGKTVVATRIAKKFYYHNGFPNHRSRILIITPPALRENWETEMEMFGLDDAVKIINNGSLHKIRDPEKYDLIIIDEAHKFRNDTADGYDLLQKLCKTRTKHRLPDDEFARKKVILISATPLNNRPADIRNQVLLFQDGKDSTVIGNLQHFFAQRIKEYQVATNPLKTPDRQVAHAAVARIYELIREQVVQPLTVRRTRTDLVEDKRWKADLDAQGIIFPKVEKPTPILYQLDDGLGVLYDRTIQLLAFPDSGGLTYNRYRAIAFLSTLELKQKYERADLVATQLARIMKTMLVKRLDSSFIAFKKSLGRFRDATQAMLTMFERGNIYIAPSLHVSDYILEDREDELIAAIAEASETDPTITACTPKDFKPEFLDGLKHDGKILDELVAAWEQVQADPKLDEFLSCLRGEGSRPNLLTKPFNETGKLVIFSEARDTTRYLTEKLNAAGFGPVLTVDSHNRKDEMPKVRANFDANVAIGDASNRRDDFHILISTEVLAEGVNLHRAHVIVNYDTPWNSTRLMQRIGRVNRIGSTAKAVHIFNFYPTTQVDDDIDLQRKAFLKLQAFHTALGEDSQIYSPDEEVDNFGLFDRAIEEERDERLRFLSELRDFKDANEDDFRRIRNLPLRARCGRCDATQTGHTLAFIRDDRRDAFYRIAAELQEIGFVEMARAFRAEVSESAAPLPATHHEQVLDALEDFRTKLAADAVRERAVDHTAGPNEQKAMRLLAAAQGMPNVSAAEKALLVAAQHAIRVAKFQDLSRKLNALQKAVVKKPVTTAALLDKLLEIIRSYPLDVAEPDADASETPVVDHRFIPHIILSESFTTK
ncbi:MAG TPA: helicase-related protein [Candidatus Acidoferrales bacterium]|jgi:superfamily II DNA or RNA helicase|nr:helicase-related protein [Candidatus Acidoferrales bacterium]